MPGIRFSRYEFATPHQDADGNLFLDVPDPIKRRPSRKDKRAVIGAGDTLFALAWRAYEPMLDLEQDVGPSRFYWALAQLNDIVDATAPLVEGEEFRLTSVETLINEILVRPPFTQRSVVT